ncbi:enoyl-CoA hydratase-related protein [Nocardia sp. NPDC060259]|uniref:enoyl-CoA hydratase-related protein n=1 Tax=Nocardia sp. NPDC060259 TaxID=3347088 RepID=UPI00365458A0
MNSNSLVDVQSHAAVTSIRINRPGNANSLDTATRTELGAALQAASTDPGVRAVVITGTGSAFCAGQDLRELQQPAEEERPLGELVRENYNPLVRMIATMPKPVIAAVNGTAAGAGLALALAADLRIATASARFTSAFAGIGLSCDTGMSWTLPRAVGNATALDLLLRPRVVDAKEALALGLVHQVIADEEFAASVSSIAALMSAGPTRAFASIKASVAYAATATFEEALDFEAVQMTHTGVTRDHKNGVKAFLSKQIPDFLGH